MNLDELALLRSGAGEHALAAAGAAVSELDDDPLRAAQAVRARGFGADLANAALTQATLRRRAVAKFGADAHHMFFTRAGLEQATRPVVAQRRAARLAAARVRRIADLGCGIGSDAIAFARAGLRGVAVDAHPVTAAVAEANLHALGLDRAMTVRCADATTVDLTDVDAAFCDPARREGARRLFDPAAFSPPWSFVATLPDRVGSSVLKLAPGIDHDLIPSGAEAEWVSVDGDVVEAALWSESIAQVPRRATVLRGHEVASLTGPGTTRADVGGVRAYFFDPDGAVVRAHLVAEFAAIVSGTLIDARIAYVFADAPRHTPLAHCFEVIESLPFAVKRLRAALRARGVGRLEIRKRGVAVDPDQLRRDLRLSGDASRTLVLTRIDRTPAALLCRPLSPLPTASLPLTTPLPGEHRV